MYSIRGKRAFFELLPELAKASNVRLTVLRLNEEAIAWQLTWEKLSGGSSLVI